MKVLLEKEVALLSEGHAFVQVTLIGVRGEAPGNLGSKMLVTSKGLEEGTVGGGKVEARALQVAKEILESQSPLATYKWNLQTDIGMTCGGEVTLLFEPFHTKPWQIAVFGAGHVSQSLIRTLLTLNCKIDCFDSREEWLSKLPTSSNLHVHPLEALDSFLGACGEDTFFLSITQGHAADVPLLAMTFKRFPNPCYIGVIGSDIKAARIKDDLRKLGTLETSLEKLRCPVGLKLGTNEPNEIAISIAAEMMQVRDSVLAPKPQV